MPRPGNPWDNALAESFFKTLNRLVNGNGADSDSETARETKADGVSEEMEEDSRAHPQATARQRVLPQLWHGGVHAWLHAAHAPRLCTRRRPLREMQSQSRKAP